MTPERQNEIWVILPHWFRKYLRDEYDKAKDALVFDLNNQCIQTHIRFMEKYFGLHNLTAQAEEKPKEPRYNIGEKVRINCYSNGEVWDAVMHNRIVTIQDYYVKDGVNMYVLKEGCRDFGEHCLEPYTPASNVASKDAELDASQDAKISKENGQKPLDVAESVEISTKEDAYFAYRLDLAKDIAVAVIKSNKWDFLSCDPVREANKIVKRLKETEE